MLLPLPAPSLDAGRCAHVRNRIQGCRRCLDVCSAGALVPGERSMTIDPARCGSCGDCVAVCPTQAIAFDASTAGHPAEAIRAALRDDLRGEGPRGEGRVPLLLLTDGEGAEALRLAVESGAALAPHIRVVTLARVAAVGLDLLLASLAWGAGLVRLLPPATGARAVREQVVLANALLQGLGLGAGRVAVIETLDVETAIAALAAEAMPAPLAAAGFLGLGDRRSLEKMALAALRPDARGVDLPPGAPFGAVEVNDSCTFCMACTGVCPTGALHGAGVDAPRLLLREELCVQCGLCRATCPEKAITLLPRLGAWDQEVLLRQDSLYPCVRCGQPVGSRAGVEAMLARLGAHPMFKGERLELLKMCPDCRAREAREPN